ncbi:hypothetical protein ACFQ4X_11990 [Fictibacillus halophilus]|uniref:hypothetical protein n=1 Tax=Fictibacillus halophilus TaxID=1610490 RepID=UPI00362FD007
MNTKLYYLKTRYLEKNGFRRKSHNGWLPQWTKGEIVLENTWMTDDSITFEEFELEIEKKRASIAPIMGVDVFDDSFSDLRRKKFQYLMEKGFKPVTSNNQSITFEKTYPGTEVKDIISSNKLEDSCTWNDFLFALDIAVELRLQALEEENKRKRLDYLGYGHKNKEFKGPDLMSKVLPGSYGSKKGY